MRLFNTGNREGYERLFNKRLFSTRDGEWYERLLVRKYEVINTGMRGYLIREYERLLIQGYKKLFSTGV